MNWGCDTSTIMKKTKDFIAYTKIFNAANILIIVGSEQLSEEAYLSSRNIKSIELCNSDKILEYFEKKTLQLY